MEGADSWIAEFPFEGGDGKSEPRGTMRRRTGNRSATCRSILPRAGDGKVHSDWASGCCGSCARKSKKKPCEFKGKWTALEERFWGEGPPKVGHILAITATSPASVTPCQRHRAPPKQMYTPSQLRDRSTRQEASRTLPGFGLGHMHDAPTPGEVRK